MCLCVNFVRGWKGRLCKSLEKGKTSPMQNRICKLFKGNVIIILCQVSVESSNPGKGDKAVGTESSFVHFENFAAKFAQKFACSGGTETNFVRSDRSLLCSCRESMSNRFRILHKLLSKQTNCWKNFCGEFYPVCNCLN